MIKIKANSKELADQEKKIVFNIQTYVQWGMQVSIPCMFPIPHAAGKRSAFHIFKPWQIMKMYVLMTATDDLFFFFSPIGKVEIISKNVKKLERQVRC